MSLNRVSIFTWGIMDNLMGDSTILKWCKCMRVFDPITGETNSLEPERYVPPNWKPSRQPCKVCNVDYYIEMNEKHLEKLIKGE